jgi:hypothetical protein
MDELQAVFDGAFRSLLVVVVAVGMLQLATETVVRLVPRRGFVAPVRMLGMLAIGGVLVFLFI